jgi:threonine/homoserine/homoserine lactone efflux protein
MVALISSPVKSAATTVPTTPTSPAAASAALIRGWVAAIGATLTLWRQKSRERRELGELDDQQLADIGITRVDAQAFSEGWLINILNPKPSIFYLSIFPQFIDPSQPFLAQGLLLAGIHGAICVTWFSFVVVAIDRIRMMLRRPKIWRSVKGATGLILIGLATRLAGVSLPT